MTDEQEDSREPLIEPIKVPKIGKPFIQFLNEVEDLRIAMRWKDGQALMNHLVAIAPHLSKEIHGSHLDPFFYKKEDGRYKACIEWLKAKWDVDSPVCTSMKPLLCADPQCPKHRM